MKSLGKFIAIGSLFATVEEFLTIVLLKGDIGSYVFTLLILFPVFLTLVFLSSRWLDRFSHTELRRDLVHYLSFGFAGLMIEWFLIGLSPWSNPNANPFLMALFQVGMFSFWAAVAFAPRLILKEDAASRRISRAMCLFYVCYFAAVYAITVLLPREKRFGPVIAMIVGGYLALNLWFVRYFRTWKSESIA